MSKYDAFSKYLISIDTDRKELSMDQIEGLVGELPPQQEQIGPAGGTLEIKVVYKQNRGCRLVGWLVDEVVLTSKKVVFKKAN